MQEILRWSDIVSIHNDDLRFSTFVGPFVEQPARLSSMTTIQNYIAGKFVPPASGAYLDNFNPATGAISGQIPNSGPEDIEVALQAASAAFPAWSNLSLD